MTRLPSFISKSSFLTPDFGSFPLHGTENAPSPVRGVSFFSINSASCNSFGQLYTPMSDIDDKTTSAHHDTSRFPAGHQAHDSYAVDEQNAQVTVLGTSTWNASLVAFSSDEFI